MYCSQQSAAHLKFQNHPICPHTIGVWDPVSIQTIGTAQLTAPFCFNCWSPCGWISSKWLAGTGEASITWLCSSVFNTTSFTLSFFFFFLSSWNVKPNDTAASCKASDIPWQYVSKPCKCVIIIGLNESYKQEMTNPQNCNTMVCHTTVQCCYVCTPFTLYPQMSQLQYVVGTSPLTYNPWLGN